MAEMDWAKTVRYLRTRLRLNQGALAELTGVSQTYISRIEAGSATPSPKVAEAIQRLRENPRTRAVFDDFLSSVRFSPFDCLVLDRIEDALVVVATSSGLQARIPGLGVLVDLNDTGPNELCRQAILLFEAGLCDGRIAGARGLWQDGETSWQVNHSPVRDEAAQWFLYISLSEIAPAEFIARQAANGSDPVIDRIG